MLEIEKYIAKSQYESDDYRNAVVDEIIEKWSIRSIGSMFHAILATSSIPEAIRYYQIFKKKNHNLKITAVFDPSDDNESEKSILKMQGITEILTDYREMFGNSYDHSNYSSFKEDVCARLAHKKQHRNIPKDKQLNLVIVVNQLLTGFDSKWINTLYLDKVLDGKNLVQAISRTNRLYGPEKPHGIIVWYRYPHSIKKIGIYNPISP